jgi:hypothetical protein
MGLNDRHFEKLRKAIFNELLQASLHYEIFWELHAAHKDIADVRNVYLSFFVVTMRAHQNLFCVRVYNVTKYDNRTSNFPRLLNYIRSNAALSEVYPLKQIEGMLNVLSEHEEIISKIQIVRNQYVAHNQLTKKDLISPSTYTYDEGAKLLKALQRMLNSLSSQYDGNVFTFDVFPKLNIEQMLFDLNEHHQSKLDKLRMSSNQP